MASLKARAQQELILPIKTFDTESGISSGNIKSILMDKFGYLWISTQGGLNRFDGRNFTLYNSSITDAKHRTIGNAFTDLITDSSGNTLFAITGNGGLNFINIITGQVTRSLSSAELFPEQKQSWIRKIFRQKNKLYLLSNKSQICQLNLEPDNFAQHQLLALPASDLGKADNLFVQENGFIYLFFSDGALEELEPLTKGYRRRKMIPAIKGQDWGDKCYYDILQLGDYLVAASSRGLVGIRLSRRELGFPASMAFLPMEFIHKPFTALAASGDQLFMANSSGIYKAAQPGNELKLLVPQGLRSGAKWVKQVFALLPTQSGLWAGSPSGLISFPNLNSPFTAFIESLGGDPVRIEQCYHLAPVNDSLLLACSGVGLFETNFRNGKIKQLETGLVYYQAIRARKNEFLLSTGNGLKRYRNNQIIPLSGYPKLDRLFLNDFIIASLLYQDSLLFLASYNGRQVTQLNLNTGSIRTIDQFEKPAEVADARINNLFVGANGDLYIIYEKFLAIYRPGTGKVQTRQIVDPDTGMPLPILMDICEAASGFFLADYGEGIIETDKDFRIRSKLTAAQPYNNIGLYKIFSLNDSLIAASSNNGLLLYNTNSRKLKLIDKAQGLHSNGFEETSGARAGQYVFVGGNSGLTMINTTKLKNNPYAPILHIDGYSILTKSGTTDSLSIDLTEIRVPNNYAQVSINFSGLEYQASEQVSYLYRIGQLNSNWINIGRQNKLVLLGLSPGKYLLELQAFNEDGLPSSPVRIALVFLPKWYQTWWFKLLLLVLIAGIFYLFYRMRINQVQRENRIRNQIASDLHDDLGSTLNSVKVYANLALMNANNTSYLQKIKEASQEAISSVRDLIWVLDDKKDSLNDLLIRIRHFAEPLCAANGIHFKLEAFSVAECPGLQKEEKRSLYLIAKETVNNAIKYAEAQQLLIRIGMENGGVRFEISDNGRGFDPSQVKEGNGLKNLFARVSRINYQAQLDASPGQGTYIRIWKP